MAEQQCTMLPSLSLFCVLALLVLHALIAVSAELSADSNSVPTVTQRHHILPKFAPTRKTTSPSAGKPMNPQSQGDTKAGESINETFQGVAGQLSSLINAAGTAISSVFSSSSPTKKACPAGLALRRGHCVCPPDYLCRGVHCASAFSRDTNGNPTAHLVGFPVNCTECACIQLTRGECEDTQRHSWEGRRAQRNINSRKTDRQTDSEREREREREKEREVLFFHSIGLIS